MTEQQKLDMLRQILTALGTVATALGFASADMIATWINVAMQVAGPIVIVVSVIWGFLSNRKSTLVAGVDQMSGVAGVITTRTPEGVALASSVESNTVTPAGSTAATNVAK